MEGSPRIRFRRVISEIPEVLTAAKLSPKRLKSVFVLKAFVLKALVTALCKLRSNLVEKFCRGTKRAH